MVDNTTDTDSSPPASMLSLSLSLSVSLSLSQVEPLASNLNTNDVFVLKAPDATLVWRGLGASDDEMAGAKHVAAVLGGGATDITEGKEPGKGAHRVRV